MPETSQPELLTHRGSRTLLWAVVATIAFMSLLVLNASGPAAAAESAPTKGKAAYEISFLKEMIMHHHMAIMMAEACVERTDIRPELRELCEGIIADQDREVADMQTWLRDWYGINYNPMAEMDMDEMMAEMAAMRAMSPAEFEQFFLEEMIAHHTAAVRAARPCQGRASHDELRDLCGQIIDAQVAEIRLMRQLLCDWYGECRNVRKVGLWRPAA